jgi:hypothetical protein
MSGESRLPQNFYEDADIRVLHKLGCHSGHSKEEVLRAIEGKDVPLLLFGVSGKKIAALFAQARSDSWLWASALSDGNADHVQAMLSLTETIPYVPALTRLMSTLSFETKFRLLKATTFKYRGTEGKVDWELLRELVNLWEEIGEPDVRQFGRIRCWFSLREDLRRMWSEVMPDEPLHQPRELENLSGGSWTISVPMTSKELRSYGMELHNCLGGSRSQIDKINSGESIFFVVCEEGKATHAVEISVTRKEIVQFLAARNCEPDEEIKAQVTAALCSQGWIDNPDK